MTGMKLTWHIIMKSANMIQNVRSVENRIMKTDGFHCRPVKWRSCKKYGHTSKFSELYPNYQKKCLNVKKTCFTLLTEHIRIGLFLQSKELSLTISRRKYDVFVITGTWLNDNICVYEISMYGYNLYRKDKQKMPELEVSVCKWQSRLPCVIIRVNVW